MKTQTKLKELENYVLKFNLYEYFSTRQKLLISGKKC